MVTVANTEFVEEERVEMNVPDGAVVVEDASGAVVVEGSSNAAVVLSSGIFMQGLQVYNPGATSDSMTYSAPQTDSAVLQTDAAPETDSAPQVPMDGITYEAPQAPVPSESVAATDEVVEHPLVAVTAEESAPQPDPEPQTSQ